jgi:pyruvate/2-oxoglutarate dehydrogenase complex dihydrolipoamide acyltransferase (E2) component
MSVEVRVPQWGMGMNEGIIVEWRVAVGDTVAEGDELVEVEAAKASDVITAPAAGVVTQILAAVDDEVPVGDVIAIIEPS